jgi:hypothetical protein
MPYINYIFEIKCDIKKSIKIFILNSQYTISMFSFGVKFCQKEKLFLGLQVATLMKAVFGFFFRKNKGFGLVCQIYKTCSYMRLLNGSRIAIFFLSFRFHVAIYY